MKPFALAWATGDCLTWLTRIVENRLMFPLTKSWLKFWLQKESTRVAQTFWRWAFSILDSRSRERISSTGFICLELLCSFRKLALIFFSDICRRIHFVQNRRKATERKPWPTSKIMQIQKGFQLRMKAVLWVGQQWIQKKEGWRWQSE